MEDKNLYREVWLAFAATELRPLFENSDETVKLSLPDTLRVSCGFPSRGALSTSKRRLGECWQTSASKDGVHQIFVTPLLDNGFKVLEVLVHEMLHAALPKNAKHGKLFKAGMRHLGLEGAATSTFAGEALAKRLNDLNEKLGTYPNAAIIPTEKEKKQTTRLIKLGCKNAEHTEEVIIRTTRKVLDLGTPVCFCGEEFVEEVKEEK